MTKAQAIKVVQKRRMDPKEALIDMLKNDKPKSLAHLIESILPEIERCLAAGLSYREIVDKLKESEPGFSASPATLAATVSRLRKNPKS